MSGPCGRIAKARRAGFDVHFVTRNCMPGAGEKRVHHKELSGRRKADARAAEPRRSALSI
jgi:hypothetical protein